MWSELGLIFTSMQWYVIVLLCVGVLFVVVECFMPGFGFFGTTGLLSMVGGIIAHGIVTKSFVQVIGLVLIFALVLIILFLLFIRSARFGLLGKSPIVQKQTAVPVNYGEKSQFDDLIGEVGEVVAALRPSGKFTIGDKIYEGIASSAEMIDVGAKVKVVAVEGNKIIVDKVEEV